MMRELQSAAPTHDFIIMEFPKKEKIYFTWIRCHPLPIPAKSAYVRQFSTHSRFRTDGKIPVLPFHPADTAVLRNDSDSCGRICIRFRVPVLRSHHNGSPADAPEPAWNADFSRHPLPRTRHYTRNWISVLLPHRGPPGKE